MQRVTGVLLLIVIILLSVPSFSLAETDAERKARLTAELQQLDQQILSQQKLVEQKQSERQSLERDVDLLDAQVNKAQLDIKARALAIEQLSDQIGEKEVVLEILAERLAKQHQSIAELIRKTAEVDEFSLIELLLSNQNFSEFFSDFEDYRTINNSLKDSMKVLEEIQLDTNTQKSSLEDKQSDEMRSKQLQEQEKAYIEAKEKEKTAILGQTKGEEEAYKQMLAETQKSAAELRSQLFQLAGGGGKIPFPEAVSLAKFASSKTGVSAAFILSILEQESEYGSNIGQCTYDQIVYGHATMGPGSVPVFKVMAEVLGFDIKTQLVSCPFSYGWGGAMGPSQFIPSTWAMYGGYVNTGNDVYVYKASEDAIRTLLGINTPSNPFRNQDAFLATALLMRDNGAAAGTYNAEWTAAIRYYAGWNGVSNSRNHFYGDQVMARKARIEADIKTLDAG